jgi:hypothetical protein
MDALRRLLLPSGDGGDREERTALTKFLRSPAHADSLPIPEDLVTEAVWKRRTGIVSHLEYAWFSSHIYKLHEVGRDASKITEVRASAPIKHACSHSCTSRLPTPTPTPTPTHPHPHAPTQGWELLCTASEFELNQEGYSAAAYLARETQTVVIAQRGTADEGGVYTDVFLFFTEVPYHIHLAAAFTACVERRLAALGLERCSISYTGHSLGAVIAACCACREGRYAVTFDSPGEAPLVQRLLPGRDLASLHQHVLCFVSKPNLANTLHAHVGALLRLATSVDSDWNVVKVRRATEFYAKGQTWVNQWLVIPTLRMNLPQSLDENLGTKINYLLRHRDRHIMRLFKQTFRASEHPPCERVVRWPTGTLQCFLFDSCDAHRHSAAVQQGDSGGGRAPLAQASEEALATIFETAEYDARILSGRECGEPLLTVLTRLKSMGVWDQAGRLLRARKTLASWEWSALVNLAWAAQSGHFELRKSELVFVISARIDKFELLRGLQRFQPLLLHHILARGSKL